MPIINLTNQIIPPVVCKPIVRGQQNISMLAPLAGVTFQDNTPYTSPWVFVGAGSSMQVSLVITKLVGTFLVLLETVGTVGNEPRFLCVFSQTPGQTGPVEIFGALPVCDDYVRVVATPGASTDQRCDWIIAGQAIVPFAPIT